MTDADPRQEVDTLRQRLKTGEYTVQFDADRRHLRKMSDNIRLVPSEIGDHRHLKLLQHCARMAALALPPSIEDFRENDEADTAGITTEDEVERSLTSTASPWPITSISYSPPDVSISDRITDSPL